MSKKSIICLSFLCLTEFLSAQEFSYTPQGAKIEVSTEAITSEVIFYSPSIVRIVKYPLSRESKIQKKSYSIILPPQRTNIFYENKGNKLVMKTSCLTVSLNRDNGSVIYTDLNKNLLLKEKSSTFSIRKNDSDKGALIVSQSFALDKNEAIFGLGQRQCPELNQRGQKVRIWSENTNITIPYITSEKGYGLYWDNAGDSQFIDSQEETTFTSEVAQCIDYYFIYKDGTQDGVISGIRQLTGKATIFPLWTMGYWQSRDRYKSTDEICGVVKKYRDLHVPLDGIVQDWQYWGCDSNWNAMKFMNPNFINKRRDAKWLKYLPNKERQNNPTNEFTIKTPMDMINYIHQHNAHLMISIWPSFGPWTHQYKELSKIGALLPFDSWPKKSGVLPYDPFNPKARDIYWKYLTELYNMGIDAWWTDATEPEHYAKPGDDDYKTYDGSWRSVKNVYSLVTNKAIYEHQRCMKGNNKRSVQMTRCSAFGIQHYATFSWSGDIMSNWNVMKNQVPSGLNYVICGIPYWNTDIGGFFGSDFGNNPKNPAMQELQVRWMEWGCFMPLMRNHCSAPMIDEIYNFGSPGEWPFDIQKKYIELRYRLLPYIYSNAGDVYLNDGSMIRAFVMDFAKDKKAINRNDEYMFGHSILVKPVTEALYTWKDEQKNGHTIYPDITKASAPEKVYLPEGNYWYDFWTNEKIQGGKEIQKLCPIQIMPLYVKAGSIIPFGPAVQYSNEQPWDNLEIRVYPGADGNFTLYEDEGDNYNYEKNCYTTITFNWNDAKKELSIGNRNGNFKGMLKTRNFNIVIVNDSTAASDVSAVGKNINYEGNFLIIHQ